MDNRPIKPWQKDSVETTGHPRFNLTKAFSTSKSTSPTSYLSDEKSSQNKKDVTQNLSTFTPFLASSSKVSSSVLPKNCSTAFTNTSHAINNPPSSSLTFSLTESQAATRGCRDNFSKNFHPTMESVITDSIAPAYSSNLQENQNVQPVFGTFPSSTNYLTNYNASSNFGSSRNLFGNRLNSSYYDNYNNRLGLMNPYNNNYGNYSYGNFAQSCGDYSPFGVRGGFHTGLFGNNLDNSWFGRTADTLGKFSYMLDMNTSFMDQIFCMALNLAGRVRLISANLSWVPSTSSSLTRKTLNFLKRKLIDFEQSNSSSEEGSNFEEDSDVLEKKSNKKAYVDEDENFFKEEIADLDSSLDRSLSGFSDCDETSCHEDNNGNSFIQSFYRVESLYMDRKRVSNNKVFSDNRPLASRKQLSSIQIFKLRNAKNRLRVTVISFMMLLILIFFRFISIWRSRDKYAKSTRK